MRLLILMFALNILIADTQQNTDHGFCEATSKTCRERTENFKDTKLLFYDVNPPEGFNLRRDVYMRFAIMLSDAHKRGKRLDWRLVLPPFQNIYHWKSTNRKKPYPWGAFFDIDSLKSFVPILELYEVFNQVKKLQIDTLYVLQNFDDPFENGEFENKWQINKDCYYDGGYWGYNNITVKETVCVRFQGPISKLWELITMHRNDKMVMIAHGELPLHDTYGTKTYWDCRKSMKFKPELVSASSNYIKDKLDCTTDKCISYVSVHWRRQDFAYSRTNDVPTIAGTVRQIDVVMKKYLTIKNIFIASDAKPSEMNQLESQLKSLGYEVYFYLPTWLESETYGDGGLAIIDQIICSRAIYFIGTHDSTFSFRIQEEREILGFESSTTFNRLCPDKGKCEKPSQWTIIN